VYFSSLPRLLPVQPISPSLAPVIPKHTLVSRRLLTYSTADTTERAFLPTCFRKVLTVSDTDKLARRTYWGGGGCAYSPLQKHKTLDEFTLKQEEFQVLSVPMHHASRRHTELLNDRYLMPACKCRDSGSCGYGLEYRGSRVPFPIGDGNISLHHRVQTGSGAYSASYSMGTGGSIPAGGLSCRGVKLSTHLYLAPRSRMRGLYLHSPICLHGVVCLIKHRDLTLTWPIRYTLVTVSASNCGTSLHAGSSMVH
jgi:hypothetical protein